MKAWKSKIKQKGGLPTEPDCLVILQESWRLRRPFCRHVNTPARLPLPQNLPPSPQTLAVVIGCWIWFWFCSLVGCGEVYRFITWLRALCLPLLRNVPASSTWLPTAWVSRVLLSLSCCIRAPAAWVEGSVEMRFVLRRVWIFESRWAGSGVGDRFGPGGQRQGWEDAVIHWQQFRI